ncbi:MAG: nuclear transport factor 2 family protein [Saprospiraceae bacterium]
MTPKQVVEKWIEAFNAIDIETLGMLYHEDAINHQVMNEPLAGRAAIREMFVSEFARAKMVCIRENIFEDGDWAILEWKDPQGLRGCGFFNVLDDQIVFQRGYFDMLSFLKQQNLPIPE